MAALESGGDRVDVIVERMRSVLGGLQMHPGIAVSGAAELRPGVEGLESEKEVSELPPGAAGFYKACGGFAVEWETAEPGLRPSDRKDSGSVRLLPLWDAAGRSVLGDAAVGGVRTVDAFGSPDAYVGFRVEDGVMVYVVDGSPTELGLSFLDYVELAVVARGYKKWQSVLEPDGCASPFATRFFTVSRYLFSDFRADLYRKFQRSDNQDSSKQDDKRDDHQDQHDQDDEKKAH